MERQRGVKPLAILVGVATDIGGTIVVSSLMGVIATIILMNQGANIAQLPDELAELTISLPFAIASLLLGLFWTAVGGFMAGWFAPHARLLHGALVGVVSTVLAFAIVSFSAEFKWHELASIIGTFPVAVVGSALAPTRKPVPVDEDFDEDW